MCSSIQASSTSSCSGLNPTAPSTPKPPAFDTATTTSRQWVKAKMGNSIPRSSQIGVRISCFLSPGDRHLLDAVDEVAREPVRRPGQLDPRQALDDLPHGGLDLGPGQAGA